MRRVRVSETFATVGAREDIDGECQTVTLCPNRDVVNAERIELLMDPPVARALARRLNRWAKLASS